MDILLTLHSWVRWLVLAAAVFGILVTLRRVQRPARVAGPAFLGLLDLQLLLGLLVFVFDAEARSGAMPHVGLMGTAVVLAHGLRARAKRRGAGGPLRAVSLFALPLLFILIGLWALG